MPKPAGWAGLHEIKFARALHSHQNVINLTHSRAIRAHPNPAKSSPSGPGLPKAGAFPFRPASSGGEVFPPTRVTNRELLQPETRIRRMRCDGLECLA